MGRGGVGGERVQTGCTRAQMCAMAREGGGECARLSCECAREGMGDQKPQICEAPHLKEGEQVGLPMGPVRVPGWFARAGARSPCGPSSHSCPTLSGMGAMPAPWPPAWRHPNIGGHHRFTRGILRGRGRGHSQEPLGKPESKGSPRQKRDSRIRGQS